ncbi:MAG TPA: DUF222 domain-containing protein, partial [Streptosporangiaceae bacterium]
DPESGPDDAFLACLTPDQQDALADHLATLRPRAEREAIGAGFTHRQAAGAIAAGEAGWEAEWTPARPAGPAAGFAAGGPLDLADAGPLLAELAEDVSDAGLGRLSDDELVGLIGTARRLASWQAAAELAAIAELDARRRRDATARAARGSRQDGRAVISSTASEQVSAEVAAALTLTGRTADSLLCLARDLARLPAVRDRLSAGRIDLAKARVFATELAPLPDLAACQIAGRYLGRAAGWTTSQLRRALRAAVLSADPDAASRRARRAREDARVEAGQEGSGNGAIGGRELPPAETLAADARLSRIARALKASGAPGTLDQLRAHVFMALLLGTSPWDLPGTRLATTRPPAGTGRLDQGGSIHLTLPALTWLGLGGQAGELDGFGPIDAHTSRDLADLLAAAGSPGWHVTLTDPAGRAMAHACDRRGPEPDQPGRPSHCPSTGPPGSGPPSTGPPGSGPSGTGPPGQHPPDTRRPDTRPPPGSAAGRLRWLTSLTFDWLETDPCTHRRQTTAYQPGRRLRHLLAVRNPVCTAPGCSRPARGCDNEHTVPHHRGGRTCECNCAPACRRHHRVKQTPGWTVTQPEPGTLAWTTPSGRTYTTAPRGYSC